MYRAHFFRYNNSFNDDISWIGSKKRSPEGKGSRNVQNDRQYVPRKGLGSAVCAQRDRLIVYIITTSWSEPFWRHILYIDLRRKLYVLGNKEIDNLVFKSQTNLGWDGLEFKIFRMFPKMHTFANQYLYKPTLIGL